MPEQENIERWIETIRNRYESYLKTSFYFKDRELRKSFRDALRRDGELLKGPIREDKRDFRTGVRARELAEEYFPGRSGDLSPALLDVALYAHQELAIRATEADDLNVAVATGTGSGKTECFLYPILFDLYRQHLDGRLQEPGVRAMVLYPMNALANDQRRRLGEICEDLHVAGSRFAPTFGQYIGQTPENKLDRSRNAADRGEERLHGEVIFRDEMRINPPHILLTNYSMLEYLLIRPDDSPLFDGSRGQHWQFIVLDEAHQYRGAKGMEMGMLVRRLKQRLRDGGRQDTFRCIATSATMTSGEDEKERRAVAEFAKELFGEPFQSQGVVFGQQADHNSENGAPRRYHAFLRALEGAFLVHEGGRDNVILNRKEGRAEDGSVAKPLEIALCKECGQHYYVGRARDGLLMEAVRDPSHTDFGVEYYLPLESNSDEASHFLCRRCGALSTAGCSCECGDAISVKKCETHTDRPDQLKECATCEYRRGGIGDPVQEIVHGSDAPNAVIATALHELMPPNGRKVLAFADSRQEAAFFAWYIEDSYKQLRDRNMMLRALKDGPIGPGGLSIDDLRNRLFRQWDRVGMFEAPDTTESKKRKVLAAILREALSDEKRISLAGVGLAKWSVRVPDGLQIPESMRAPPWNFSYGEARALLSYLLDEMRSRYAMALPDDPAAPSWGDVSPQRRQTAFSRSRPMRRPNVREWGGGQSATVGHYLFGLLADSGLSREEKVAESVSLMKEVWARIRVYDGTAVERDKVLWRAEANGIFRLNPRWLRIALANPEEIWECDTCASISSHNIRGICPRYRCPGRLATVDVGRLDENHYRILYQSSKMPPTLRAEEHTAQIDSDRARELQNEFKNGQIHLLSSSTTFEVGVDLGDLEAVFLRNVPPEPFNYTQRVGRVGRRNVPGLALTYCRRSPHDLYHYENPKERVIDGKVQPPRLRMTNEKIISRHVVAVALAAFFKHEGNNLRFKNVEALIGGDWVVPSAVSGLSTFCQNNRILENSLRQIVPKSMHGTTGLVYGSWKWIDKITGSGSRFATIEAEVCADYREMEKLKQVYFDSGTYSYIDRIDRRIKTIKNESTLMFLSRKAVIPKYGFPVDVVELGIL